MFIIVTLIARHDNSECPLEKEIVPGPVYHHQYAVLEPDQLKQVNSQPTKARPDSR